MQNIIKIYASGLNHCIDQKMERLFYWLAYRLYFETRLQLKHELSLCITFFVLFYCIFAHKTEGIFRTTNHSFFFKGLREHRYVIYEGEACSLDIEGILRTNMLVGLLWLPVKQVLMDFILCNGVGKIIKLIYI